MDGLFSKLCTAALICVSSFVATSAQKRTCDLELKVFSYDALSTPLNRLINVSAELKGERTEQKGDLSDVSKSGFKGLAEGSYKLEFQKSGYKKRSKQVDLDCDLAGENGSVLSHIYLWRDKKSQPDVLDLVSDVSREAGTKSDTKIKSTPSDEKIFGNVTVKVLIDEDGNVVSASRIDGDKKLAERAIRMVRQAKFSPTLISGFPVKVTGSMVYNFVP